MFCLLGDVYKRPEDYSLKKRDTSQQGSKKMFFFQICFCLSKMANKLSKHPFGVPFLLTKQKNMCCEDVLLHFPCHTHF